MALNRNDPNVNMTSAGIGLIVIETTSELRGPICGHLKPYVVTIHGMTSDGTRSDIDIDSTLYPSCDNLIVTNETLVQLVSIPLTTSTWKLTAVHGVGLYYEQVGKTFGLGKKYLGNFNWSFNKQAGPLPPRCVLYLGHVKMHQRLRTSDAETVAGGPIPLIDQKVSRFRESTFDVEVTDCQDADLRLFREGYPSLKAVQVEKTLLH